MAIDKTPREKWGNNINFDGCTESAPSLEAVLGCFDDANLPLLTRTYIAIPSDKEKQRPVESVRLYFKDDPEKLMRAQVVISFGDNSGMAIRELRYGVKRLHDAAPLLETFELNVQKRFPSAVIESGPLTSAVRYPNKSTSLNQMGRTFTASPHTAHPS